MSLDAVFEKALTASEPVVELRQLAQRWLNEGQSTEQVLAAFEHARQSLREQGREGADDTVMDVMDQLSGWCAPHAKLTPQVNGATQSNRPLEIDSSKTK